ncbi:MAG: hypothetical protein ACI9JL_001129 [Paracoccaceae bacterium]|jgi:uncharacterized protein (DUF924 family)
MAEWREIYDFWFGAPGSEGHGDVREFWFASTPDIDRELKERFLDQYHRAAAGDLEDWKSDARGWVALIVLLDQVPRNIFRGNGKSFAADPVALALAKELVASPLHDELITVEKVFAYLPFEHSENVDDQRQCVAFYEAIDDHESKAEWIEFAVAHLDIVAEFGRFPHRNAMLGRENTAAETAWHKSSNQNFGTVPESDN